MASIVACTLSSLASNPRIAAKAISCTDHCHHGSDQTLAVGEDGHGDCAVRHRQDTYLAWVGAAKRIDKGLILKALGVN
jgi:hypothetical protein